MARTFDEEERKAASRLLAALECFREMRTTMPLQYVFAFLLVALDEGKTVGEYAIKAGVSPSVMSRHIMDIGIRNRKMQPGFELVVTKQNVVNLREHTVHLTDKGRALFRKLARHIG